MLLPRSAPVIVLSGVLCGWPAPALPQPRTDKPPRPGVIAMAAEPVRLESVGLSVLIPEGSIAQTQRAGRVESVQITPPLPDQTWAVTIQTPMSADAELLPGAVAEAALKQLAESVGVNVLEAEPGRAVPKEVKTSAAVLQKVTELRIPGCAEPGARFYVKLPRARGESPSVRGYAAFRAAPGRFVVFELFTTEPEFDRVRPLYESIVANARFAPPGEVAAGRGVAVEAGIALIARLGPEELRRIVESRGELLLRTYKEAPTGADADAEEIGYQRVRARSGFRGELDAARSRDRWAAADRQEGFIVSVEGRQMLRDEGVMVDSRGVYFMTPDRAEEAWVLDMGLRPLADRLTRRTAATGSWHETGARAGESMTVTVSRSGEPGRTIRPTVPDQGYINQVEMLLMPYILLSTKQPGEYGFYAYQSQNDRVAMRRDTLERAPDRPGAWVLTTRATEDAPPRIAVYSDRGDLVRVTLPNRGVIEPIAPERLMQIWKSKGLPLD